MEKSLRACKGIITAGYQGWEKVGLAVSKIEFGENRGLQVYG